MGSLLSFQADDHGQGGMMGVSRSVSTLARVAGPVSAGLLFSVFGRNWPYYGGALVMAIVVILAIRIHKCTNISENE